MRKGPKRGRPKPEEANAAITASPRLNAPAQPRRSTSFAHERERCPRGDPEQSMDSVLRAEQYLEILRAHRGPERDLARTEGRGGACGHRGERRRQVDPDAHPFRPSAADERQSSSQRQADGSRGPVDAEREGIVLVHQEILLAPDLTVAQNLFLGREIAALRLRGRQAMRERARADPAPSSARRSTRMWRSATSPSPTGSWSRSRARCWCRKRSSRSTSRRRS